MSLLDWFDDRRRIKESTTKRRFQTKNDGSKGLWTQCDSCNNVLYIKHLKENQYVCTTCGYHLRMNSTDRIQCLVDKGTWVPLFNELTPTDPLVFQDKRAYAERLTDAQNTTGLKDAIQTGLGKVNGHTFVLGTMDFAFMGGSMGSVVGEKITRLIEYATEKNLPIVIVCASGGARMQEGIFSLMQMAKISSALHQHKEKTQNLYIPILTYPTTGGVTASFAMLGDMIIAEPKALIGFAGRRVIEQTLQEQLPPNFQTAEYLLQHGLVDLIIPRLLLKQALSEIFEMYTLPVKIFENDTVLS
jgi:acetyl-CoA carboxylase carboxyl transferase subunit beta